MKKSHRLSSRVLAGTSALAMSLLGFMPLMAGRAAADQATSRSLTLSTAVADATNVTYSFQFDGQFASDAASNVGSIEILFCTTALNSCTAPAGLDVSAVANGDILTQEINNSATSFTVGTNTANLIQLTRTAASVNDNLTFELVFDNIDNPSTNTQTPAGNNTFFARISVYATNSYTTLVSDGTVAAAIVPVLTINARVQEILHFCVGAETNANVTAWDGTTDCASVTNTLVDLGPVDSTAVTTSPDSDGNNRNGILMMRTNASGGSISYKSISNGGNTSGALKKAGDNCSLASGDLTGSPSNSDGCLNYATAGNNLSTAVEGFGMWLDDDSDVDDASASATTNLNASAPYSTASTYAWQPNPATSTQIASQTNGVDDEAFKIRFGARTVLTTQTGNYSTSADFIAVATY